MNFQRLLFAGCLMAAFPAVVAARPNAPNIVFIMADDHAAQALSCYGSRINQTPHLDRLAKEGMRFDRCFCTNSICAPSRAVILSGRYSHQNGVRDNREPFDGSQVTFPKLLQRAGYRTAMIGKWHLKSDPTGFDHWNILPGQGRYNNPVFRETGQRRQYDGYVTDVITDLAIAWLKEQDDQHPFCLLCHHKAPHANWTPAAKHAQLYADRDISEPGNTIHANHRPRRRVSTHGREHQGQDGERRIPFDRRIEAAIERRSPRSV